MNCPNCHSPNAEGAKFCLIALTQGRVSAAQGDDEQALAAFARAESLALEMGMRPIVWQARAGAAVALSGLGRNAEAEAKRREAKAVIDEIAGLFQDAELRSKYVDNAAPLARR